MSAVLELRCDNELHAKFDPDGMVVVRKCKSCTRKAGRPVFHRWPLAEIVERYARGEIGGVCPPDAEHVFVHWRVGGG